MWQSLPEFGTGVIYAILVAAAYTFAVSLGAGRGRPQMLVAARFGTYATWTDDAVAWRGRSLDLVALARERERFALSFGSCSFEEPIGDLKSLGWLA